MSKQAALISPALFLTYVIAFFGALSVLPSHPQHEVHVFLAEHYARDFGTLWDGRWYGGASLLGHPPLLHVLLGGLAKTTGLGAETLYALSIPMICVFAVHGLGQFAARLFVEQSEEQSPQLLTTALALNPLLYFFVFPLAQSPFILALAFSAWAAVYNRAFVATAIFTAAAICTHPLGILLPASFVLLATIFNLVGGERPAKEFLVSSMTALLAVASGILAGMLLTQEFWQLFFGGGFRKLAMDEVGGFTGLWQTTYAVLGTLALAAIARRRRTWVILGFLSLALMVITTLLPKTGMGHDKGLLLATFLLTPVVVWLAQWLKRYEISGLAPWGYALALVAMGFCAGTIDLTSESLQRRFRHGLKPVMEVLSAPKAEDFSYLTLGIGAEKIELSRRVRAGFLDGGMPWLPDPILADSEVPSLDDLDLRQPKDQAILVSLLKSDKATSLRWVVSVQPSAGDILHAQGFKERHAWRSGIVLWENQKAKVASVPGAKESADKGKLWSWGSLLMAIAALCLHSIFVGKEFWTDLKAPRAPRAPRTTTDIAL